MAPVVIETRGALGHIRLSRPEALNALTPEMIALIDTGLTELLANPTVTRIAISGEGPRGFCAGGDIKLLGQMGRDDPAAALAFWRAEYRLNARIHRLEKPWIALMDGICMGGGVGLSVHGSHRIVTERTRFAMPETGIGYFPDVGASYALPRAKDFLGYYLGMTGASVSGADALAAGLADYAVPAQALPELMDDLAEGKALEAVFLRHQTAPAASVLDQNRALIARAFSLHSLPEIIAALEADGSEFAAETVAKLRHQSPTALTATLHLLRRGAKLPDLETCLAQELAADAFFLNVPDFYEGIRAAVIDKDRNPRWQPPHLEALDQPEFLARFEVALSAAQPLN